MTDTLVPSSPFLERAWWQRLGAGGLAALEALLLVAVTAAWAVPQALAGSEPPPWAVGASAALLVAILGTLVAAGGVRAMALQTFWQCLRMKVAAAFIVLLAAALAVLPSIMTGDGTLAGSIQSLLSYGVSITVLLLSVVTVLLSTSVVAGDIRHRQVFLTATKPLERWQYVVGRWLGIVILDALLLALAMAAVYALAQHLRRQPEKLAGEDRRTVESEIFTARGKVYPDPVDLEGRVQERVGALKADRRYQDAVESQKQRVGDDPQQAEQALLAEIRKQVAGERNSAGPGGMMMWSFSGIRTAGAETFVSGTVERALPEANQVRIRIDPSRSGLVLYGVPLHVEDVAARVVEAGPDFVVVQFDEAGLRRLGADPRGRDVVLTIDPTVQLSYKASATGNLPDDLLAGLWVVRNPEAHVQYGLARRDPVNRPNTLTLFRQAVSADGHMDVQFYNVSQTSVSIDPADIFVLYPAGAFEWNFLRATLLILLQLAFLAAIGVLAASFLSFQVAVMVCLVLLLFSLARSFVASAVQITSIVAPGVDVVTAGEYLAVRFVSFLLPDFAETWPSDRLVDGLHIGWSSLGQTAAVVAGVRTLIYLGLGCLIFHRRELARVQV